jgi:hypothetical protein
VQHGHVHIARLLRATLDRTQQGEAAEVSEEAADRAEAERRAAHEAKRGPTTEHRGAREGESPSEEPPTSEHLLEQAAMLARHVRRYLPRKESLLLRAVRLGSADMVRMLLREGGHHPDEEGAPLLPLLPIACCIGGPMRACLAITWHTPPPLPLRIESMTRRCCRVGRVSHTALLCGGFGPHRGGGGAAGMWSQPIWRHTGPLPTHLRRAGGSGRRREAPAPRNGCP